MNCISPSRRRKRTARNKRRLSCQKEEEADASSSLFLWFRASGAGHFCRQAKGRFPPPIFFSIVPGGDISFPRGRGTFGAAPARGTFPPPIFFSSCRKENPPEGLLLPLRGNSPPGPRPVQKKRTLFPDEPGKSRPIQLGFHRLSPLSWPPLLFPRCPLRCALVRRLKVSSFHRTMAGKRKRGATTRLS